MNKYNESKLEITRVNNIKKEDKSKYHSNVIDENGNNIFVYFEDCLVGPYEDISDEIVTLCVEEDILDKILDDFSPSIINNYKIDLYIDIRPSEEDIEKTEVSTSANMKILNKSNIPPSDIIHKLSEVSDIIRKGNIFNPTGFDIKIKLYIEDNDKGDDTNE